MQYGNFSHCIYMKTYNFTSKFLIMLSPIFSYTVDMSIGVCSCKEGEVAKKEKVDLLANTSTSFG